MIGDVAKLKLAWRWECPACGHVQIAAMAPAELEPAERAEVAAALDIDSAAPGDILTSPLVVECDHCRHEFDAEVDAEDC